MLPMKILMKVACMILLDVDFFVSRMFRIFTLTPLKFITYLLATETTPPPPASVTYTALKRVFFKAYYLIHICYSKL